MKPAKEYLSDRGYGTGTNFTFDSVAGLMEAYAEQFKPIHQAEPEPSVPVNMIEDRIKKLRTMISTKPDGRSPCDNMMIINELEQLITPKP